MREKIRKVYKFIIALHSLTLARHKLVLCSFIVRARKLEKKTEINIFLWRSRKRSAKIYLWYPRPTSTHPSKWQKSRGAENLISPHYCRNTFCKIVSFRLIEFVSSQIALSACVLSTVDDFRMFSLECLILCWVVGEMRWVRVG